MTEQGMLPPEPAAGVIAIVEYDPQWPRQFAVEAAKVRAALGDAVLQLEHAGSTSVPGLSAKPVIDITLAVADAADEGAYAPQLSAAGYELIVREPDWFQHRMFKGRSPDVNLHVFPVGCPEIARMLLFRDWLRHDATDRRLYDATKRALASQNWRFVQEYADAKSEIVAGIMARAERWRAGIANNRG